MILGFFFLLLSIWHFYTQLLSILLFWLAELMVLTGVCAIQRAISIRHNSESSSTLLARCTSCPLDFLRQRIKDIELGFLQDQFSSNPVQNP